MPSPRDSQRSKFYNWERTKLPKGRCLVDLHEHVIESYISMYGRSPVKINYSSISYGTYRPSIRTVCLPKNTPPDVSTVSIVLAFALKYDECGNKEAWHGPTFCRFFAEIYAKITNTPVAEVVKSMRDSRLKVLGAGGTIGPRMLKRHEKLKNRVEELEEALARGRAEFEQFLQPFLLELDKARAEFQELDVKIKG